MQEKENKHYYQVNYMHDVVKTIEVAITFEAPRVFVTLPIRSLAVPWLPCSNEVALGYSF